MDSILQCLGSNAETRSPYMFSNFVFVFIFTLGSEG